MIQAKGTPSVSSPADPVLLLGRRPRFLSSIVLANASGSFRSGELETRVGRGITASRIGTRRGGRRRHPALRPLPAEGSVRRLCRSTQEALPAAGLYNSGAVSAQALLSQPDMSLRVE